MIKTSAFINTNCSENFKNFINQKFNVNVLYPNINETLFIGWKGKDMLNWYKFVNEDNTVLEFYPSYYRINKFGESIHQIPLPTSINDFINDMCRFKIQLYWDKTILKIFEPKDILNKNEIKEYYSNLLNKMNKSNEILWN